MFVAETSNMNNYCKLIPTLLSRNKAKNRSILNPMVLSSVQFSSVAQSRPTLCNPMNRSTVLCTY